MSIVVTNLSKNYGSQTAVDNVSFEVKKGEIVGFLGPNGAGKSTTMKMITGYHKPDAGFIKVCDILVNSDSLNYKKKIGYLPESNPLYADMYVKEYLNFVANIHNIFSTKSLVNSIIEKVGLSQESHKKIAQLSKGYKQRVGLAASLIHDPEVLILDEPTGGLDPNQIVEIRNLIKSLGKFKTIILSTHIMQEVEALCDRVIIINKGKIVADKSIADLHNLADKKTIVEVVFSQKIEIDVLESLASANNVSAIGINGFVIETDDQESLKKQILELSINKNLNITSLINKQNSLEEIFRKYTN